MSNTKVKILYGVLAGDRMGRRLRSVLKRAGYTVVRRASDADIIIGHSAGCFWLPAAPTHQKLVLIDPPYWPGRSIKERVRERMHQNIHFRRQGYSVHRWFRRNLWNMYYAVRDYKRTKRIMRHAPYYDLEHIIRNHRVLLIRNDDDNWLTPDLERLKHYNPHIVIKQLPGDHEDWYHHPQPYVDLIQSVYGTGE